MSFRKINNPNFRFNNYVLPPKNKIDKSISIDFFSIVLSGDVTKFDQFINNNSLDVNLLNNDGINALHIILKTDLSELNKLNFIKYLILKKINIENKNKMGETPLHIASKNNFKSIIIELINNNANIQSYDSLGITPLHYLARGLISDCEDSFIENIIDDPKPKVDKKVISKIAKEIKKFYNEYLLNEWANLELIENTLPISNTNLPTSAIISPIKPFKYRLIDFFKHIKSAAKKIIEEDKFFSEDSIQIANDIKKIAVNITLSDEEKKQENEKIRTDYYNKVYKMIQRNDVRFDKNIDLTANININNYGLILANKNGNYSLLPFNQANYGPNKDTSFFKVNNEPTLNQTISLKIQENGQKLLEFYNNIPNDLDNLHNEIGKGIIETCEDLASFIYTINFYQEIYRFNKFISSNEYNQTYPYSLYEKNSPKIKKNNNLNSNKLFTIHNRILSDNNFNERYFMKYHHAPTTSIRSISANNLNIYQQSQYNAKHIFNLNNLSNKLYINNITSKNIIANENEIIINMSNFNWNFNPSSTPNKAFSLAFFNKTSKITTFISKDFEFIKQIGQIRMQRTTSIQTPIQINIKNNILIYSNPNPNWNNETHLTSNNYINNINSKVLDPKAQPRLKKLVRLRISKKIQSNNLNLSLDYIDFNEKKVTLNFDPGQYQISFLSTSRVFIGNVNFGETQLPTPLSTNISNIESNVIFDLSDFNENEITYNNFFNSHLQDKQFIFNPLIALVNEIKKNSKIINSMNRNINFIGKNFTVNTKKINDFCNGLHKWYIRYYETLNLYVEEFIRGRPYINKITNMIQNLNFNNDLQNPLYKNMKKNLENYKVDILEKIDTEISDVRDIIEKIIKDTNFFISLIKERFDYFTIYQYFNSETKMINLHYNIDINKDNSFYELDNNHFSGNSQSLQPTNLNQYFQKYRNFLEIIQPANELQIQNIGIQFINFSLLNQPTGITTAPVPVSKSFTDVEYDPRILNSYFYLTRYRMIEEIVLDIHYESESNDEKKRIYDIVKTYVEDNLGKIDPLMERSLILSIIGDLIDNYLISNVKKALFDAVTEVVNKKIRPNIENEIFLIVQSKNTVIASDNVEIDYSAVDFDVDFGLNLGEQDDLVEKALNKINLLNIDKLLELSFGDMLLLNKVKYKTEIGEKSKEIVQQIFYPSDFLSIINSNQKCVIYDTDIINLIDKKLINLNKKDYFGNSPLYYAINSQNYLFIDWLITKNIKCLDIENNDKQNPFIYVLNKLRSICDYFGNNKNILLEFNNYYLLSLKEEVNKLDNHGNIMKNLDMLILLYIFLINSSFFNEMFVKDFELLNLLKKFNDNHNFKLFDDSSYQNDFNLIFMNPIHKIYNDNLSGNNINNFDVILNLTNELKIKKEQKRDEQNYLTKKINKYNSIQTLLKPTDVSYSTNIEENKKKIEDKIETIQKSIEEINQKINKVTTDVEYNFNDRFVEKNLGFSDIFDQIFEISKSYEDNKLKDFNFNQFLKQLRKISNDSNLNNNTYFFHNLISKIIYKFIDYSEEILNQSYVESQKLKDLKTILDDLIEIMKRTMYKSIFYKNNNIKNIDKNEYLKKEYHRICFTIDLVVGNVFYKVLKRLMMTFLKTRYNISENDPNKFLQFTREKVDKILDKINKYIQPDITNDNYEPSELTKRMVLLICNYKSNENEYSSIDENDFFEYIISSIKNNGFEFINDNDPLITYFRKIFMPYFIGYYRICITKLTNVTSSYENYILNQYYNLNIFNLLLEKKLANEQNYTPTSL